MSTGSATNATQETDDIVIYVFAGRRQNLALQLPLIRRVLEEHPNVRFDVWNLVKYFADGEYVRNQIRGERIKVRHDFYNIRPWWKRFDYVWRHYTKPEYKDTLFVKLDDDVVFLETDRFGAFVEEARKAPGVISSALTINNGASLKHTPGLAKQWLKAGGGVWPLLDVHLSGEFARCSHDFALDNWDKLIDMPVKAIPTEDWLSINMIAYDYETGREMVQHLGKTPPSEIAGRTFGPDSVIGDEGACNMLPRQIVQGMLAAHLTFGPQELPESEWDAFRKRYAEAGRLYLER